jgi:hypothetical protein
MTPPEFSVLLLAWDDADPTVAVLGGAALPPTLPLVYQLAAQQPVLAVYPHLPAAKDGNATLPKTVPEPTADAAPEKAATTDSAVSPALGTTAAALATAANRPGVQLLPAPHTKEKAALQSLQSRIIGLADLLPASIPLAPSAAAASPLPEQPGSVNLATQPMVPARSQWPTGVNAPAGRWQTPAAPYLGAGSDSSFPPPPPAPPRPTSQPPAAPLATSTRPATMLLRARRYPLAGDLNFDPDPELPAITIRQPAIFDEPTEEVGAAEANDLSAPEDDLTLEVAAAEATPAMPAPLASAAPSNAPLPKLPQLDGLNFRMIQYARQAAQLVQGRQDFGVIYAPNWPAWLAALEIRNSSRLPLVLYVASLAADFTGPAERGWLLEVERMTLRRATLVLVPNTAVQRRLRALYGEAMGQVRIVAADDEAAVQRLLGKVAL